MAAAPPSHKIAAWLPSPGTRKGGTIDDVSALAPGLLVAAPTLRCPFFHHTLVLMVDHGEEGSFGFVVNKPAPIEFAEVVGELGMDLDASAEVAVFLGGPVSPETGWVIFDPTDLEDDELPDDAIRLSPRVAVTASLTMLHALATGEVRCPAALSLGYAGWSPGQLEGELREGSWIPVDLDPSLVFDVAIEDRWTRALETLGIDPARMVGRHIAQA